MARGGQGPSSGPAPLAVSAGELRVLKETLNPDLTDAELRLFALVAKRSGLDPFARQIYAVKRPTRSGARVTFQTSQEGYLSIAERTGEYDGCDEPTYGPLRAGHPVWATVRVYRKGMSRGVAATAYWDEYHPGDGAGALWAKMPRVMLAKVARVAALRLAFPYVYADLYAEDEMVQADRPTPQLSAATAKDPSKVAGVPSARSSTDVPAVSEAEVAELHRSAGSSRGSGALSAEGLLDRARESGITKARITLAAKSLYGPTRWQITELSDHERARLWADLTQ